MKKVFVQPISVSNGRYAYDLLDINGGYAGGDEVSFATLGEAYEAGIRHVEDSPESFTLVSPAAVASLLKDLRPYVHDLKIGFLEPKTQAVGYDQKTINELYNRLVEALK